MIAPRTVLAAAGVALAAALPAQQASLQRDVEFVRKLATDLGFISLAQAEVDRLQKDNKDAADFKRIVQLGIEISLIGARSRPDREERRTLFKDALDRSKDFIDRFSEEPVADQARLTMVEACYEYGRFLIDEIEIARQEAPERVKELEEQAIQVYRDGIEACEKVMARLAAGAKEDGSDAQRDYFRTWLLKAVLQREHARADERNREYLAGSARDTFEEFIFEVGEETALGLRGWFEMSKVGEILGNYEVAARDYRDTIDSIRTALENRDTLELSGDAIEFLINLLQEAYDRAAEVLFLSGDVDATLAIIGEFRTDLTTYGQEGLEPFEIAHPVYGHPVFLTEARAMAESGDAEKVAQALAQAKRINDEHPNDFIGMKAKAVLKDILRIQSGLVSGALLFEVAKGDMQAREYEKALRGFKRAYDAMTPEERGTHGLELWSSMARCYGLQGRSLEATLAALRGLELHGAQGAQPEATADVLEQAWNLFRRDSKNAAAPVIAQLDERVTQALAEHGGAGSAAKQMWRDAGRLHSEQKYAEAAEKYRGIPAGTPYYEPARGRIVVALQNAGDYAAARKAADEYRAWIATPEGAAAATERTAQTRRRETLATVAFYEAYMDYREVTGQTGSPEDRTRFTPTIAKLQAFLAEHREYGPGYVDHVYDMMARLHAQLGRIDKAEEIYRTLRSEFPNSENVPVLATQIFSAHYDNVKALETELDALVKKKADAAEIDKVEERLTAGRRAAVASGLDYLKNSAAPQYGVLFHTMEFAAALEDWKNAELVGRRLIESYGSGADADKVDRWVKPRVGQALLQQRRFKESAKFLEDALKAKPDNYEAMRYLSRVQGGWYELDAAGNVVPVAGLDDPVSAYDRHFQEYRKYALNPTRGVTDYSLEWYRFQLECFMFAKRAATKDSKYGGFADTHFRMAKSTDNWERLRSYGPEGEAIYALFVGIQ